MTTPEPFQSPYEKFIYMSRYSKWIEDKKRRETWSETVDRVIDYLIKRCPEAKDSYQELHDAFYSLEVVPSMRVVMTAGPALDRNDICAYNCAYLVVDNLKAFDEALFTLMCGTGVGFSVEEQYTSQLPRVAEEFTDSDSVIGVADSKEGWARALRELLSLLVSGRIPKWDVSRVRPAGARLRTFGGRASGPEPLEDLFRFCISLFRGAAGRKLTTIECHDLMCKIADIVVVGGVRRSAMISLSDVNDDRLRTAKTGAWWERTGYRRLSNNSAVYPRRRPDTETFMREWKALYDSKSGERGFFSRYACQAIAGRNGRRDATYEFGTNPCSEIILRPFQFCNLTEVVVRSGDSEGDLARKVRLATILGTIQSTFTDFRYLRKIWQKNCEEERLLGVSLTGVMDNASILTEDVLGRLKQVAIDTNKEWAARLGINSSAAITCVKPSGTVSQLVDASSGLHTRHSPFYIRSVRADNKDPMTQFLIDAGVYHEADVMAPNSTTVFFFAKKSPEGAITRENRTAIESLRDWEILQDFWCEHKPSATVSVREDEWMDVGAWVWSHFDKLSGVSFLPMDGGTYKQAPYQEVTEEDYNKFLEDHPLPDIDWSKLQEYEKVDTTTGSQELACTGNVCEIVMIGNPDE